MKRFLALILCLACLCSCAAFAAEETGKLTIGGKTAETVTVEMGDGVTADVVFAQGSVNKDQTAVELLAAAGSQSKPIAAVSGGMFNTDSTALDGYGAVARCYASVVKNGSVVNGGGEQSEIYLGFTKDGKALIDEVSIKLYATCNGRKTIVQGVNDYYPEPTSVLLFTPEAGYSLPVPANVKVAKIVDGKVKELMTSGTMVCAPDTYYYVCGKNVPSSAVPGVGDAVTFTTEFSKNAWNDVTTAVSCGPWLLHDGKNVFSENRKFPYLAKLNVSETALAARTFAAVLPNGDLLLGACMASPKQIIEYLLSVNAKDAMLLDGGASSMLYADGKTLRAAGRKLNNIVCLYADDTMKAEPKTAHESTQTVELDGKKITLPAYALKDEAGNDTNYVRLRDLAQLLNGTAAQFDVTWDDAAGAVEITDKHTYDHPNGTEGKVPFRGNQPCQAFAGDTLINGKVSALDAFTIVHNGGGHTYYQLRDLGRALGFNVGWTQSRGMFIETDKPYTDAN